MSDRGEQNWYPVSRIGFFTDIAREWISITRGQIELFGPAVGQPYRLDETTVNRATEVYGHGVFPAPSSIGSAEPDACSCRRTTSEATSHILVRRKPADLPSFGNTDFTRVS
ncbi:hypothetical protein [Nocardia sp. NPDC051463]|uniref:hypothetical protein n=1 Tax=Nocardia sp. NPDC051463 TaxID=3154845 RepID=UPI00342D3CCF